MTCREEAPETPAVQKADHDATIERIAAGQHGVVTRTQLIDAGIPPRVIHNRAVRRRIHRLFRGVYRVGPLMGKYGREAAAVLACGPTAALSHRSAAAIWKLLPSRSREGPTREGPIEVTIVGGSRFPGAGVRVHCTRTLSTKERAAVDGIPVTTAARTLLDLAPHIPARRLEQALFQATRRGLASTDEILALLGRYPRRAGRRRLRDLVTHVGDGHLLRSEAEARLLALVRRAGLPRPHINAAIDKYEVDFLWRRERLVVELDGFRFHGSRDAFEKDRRRDAMLTAAGFGVVRFTWRRLTDEPEALLVELSQALVKRATR